MKKTPERALTHPPPQHLGKMETDFATVAL